MGAEAFLRPNECRFVQLASFARELLRLLRRHSRIAHSLESKLRAGHGRAAGPSLQHFPFDAGPKTKGREQNAMAAKGRPVSPHNIRRIFLSPRPNVPLMTAADLLGMTLQELKRDIADG